MAGLFFAICSDIHKIQTLLEARKASADAPSSSLNTALWFLKSLSLSTDNECGKLCRLLLQDSLDIILPMNILEIVNLNSGVIGILGMVTSLMGLANVWPGCC